MFKFIEAKATSRPADRIDHVTPPTHFLFVSTYAGV